MKVIFKTVFGSHLYGTATEKSDKDFKAIFISDLQDIILSKDKKTIQENTKNGSQFGVRNTSDDVDCEYIELRKFIKDALAGQTYAIDMLFSNPILWVEYSKEWIDIVANRHRFLSRDVAPFIGYCRQQAGKYGLKGSRLAELTRVIDYLKERPGKDFLIDHIDGLSLSEYIQRYKSMAKGTPDREEEFLDVLGKKFQMNTMIHKVLYSLEKVNAVYGDRAKQAANNDGVDWKAMSHAFRCCYQLLELAETHQIKFPLVEAEFLTKVKNGEYQYNQLGDSLYELMERSKKAIEQSTLPEKPDFDFWDGFIINIYTSNKNDLIGLSGKPEAFIFDIDGTLAKKGDRSPYDWSRVDEDTLNLPVFKIYQAVKRAGYKIIIFTGRDASCSEKTFSWLEKNGIDFDEILMRNEGNVEKDFIIKERMFQEIEPGFEVVAVIDDRDQVVSMWREMGLTCLQVDYGNF